VPYIYYQTPQELLEFCQRQQIQLIHSHSRLAFPSSLLVAKRGNIPLVVTLHGVFPWKHHYSSTLAYAKKIIAIGPAQTKGAEQYKDKISIIPNGIDTKRFCPNISRSRLTSDSLKIIWFGRTSGVTSKGVLILDEAIKILRKRGIKVSAWLIGIPTGVTVKQFTELGWRDNPVSILQKGHIAFGHGRSLREAMACGNVGFLLGHGYGGQVNGTWFRDDHMFPVSAIPEYRLPEPEAEQIANDIVRYAKNNALLYRDRLRARDIAVKYFDVRKMITDILDVYQETMPGNVNGRQLKLGRPGQQTQRWRLNDKS
jgi:glycosyltransferase involved in cell wall biosynthesis